MCVCVCVRVYVCLCVCVRECVCVYVCVRAVTHLFNVVHPLFDRLEGGSIGYVKTDDNPLQTDIT